MKTEAEIKALFGPWEERVATIPTLLPSQLISCLANGEHLAVLLGFHELFANDAVAKMEGPEQATFVKHMQQIMEYTLEQVRNEVDKRWLKVDTKA